MTNSLLQHSLLNITVSFSKAWPRQNIRIGLIYLYDNAVPNGRTHETINLCVFGALAAGYAYTRSQGLLTDYETLLTSDILVSFSTSYLLGTFLITPDLDLAENNVRAKDHWGLLGLLWEPYGHLFSHRGLSHTWVIGPLTRLIYLAILVLALSWLVTFLAPYFGYSFSLRAELGENWLELATGALIGYYLSQWLHLIADGVAPDHGFGLSKRRKRKRR